MNCCRVPALLCKHVHSSCVFYTKLTYLTDLDTQSARMSASRDTVPAAADANRTQVPAKTHVSRPGRPPSFTGRLA